MKNFVYSYNSIIKHLFFVSTFLCLFFLLCSCINNTESSTEALSSVSNSLDNSQTEKYDLFSRHGLSKIIPEEYIKCSIVGETPENASILLTEYEFTVLSKIDSDLERQGYYNQIINAVRNASAEGKVYKNSENGLELLSVYENVVSESEKLVCYFKLKSGDEIKSYKLTVSDYASEGIHVYSLSLTYSDIEF